MISQIARKIEILLILALIVPGALSGQTLTPENTWPKSLDFDLGVIQLYEPEIGKFEGTNVEALAAVAIKLRSPGTAPVFAAISFSATSESAPTASIVTIHDIELTGLHFGEGVDQNPNELVTALEQELGVLTLTIDQSGGIARPGATNQFSGQGVKSEPINILFRTVASVLVALDGEPRLQPIENSDLSWVANSTFPMLYQRGTYYLLMGSESGYRSTNPQGPWTQVAQLPTNIQNLFNQTDQQTADLDVSRFENPDIIVATEPTELLVSEGIPAWAPLAGMQLLYMTNTDSDIFLDLESGRHYVLLQGRWYAGVLDKSGSTWLPVGNDELPAAFADIDILSPKSHVLAFVDGTPQARTALLENQLPQGKAVPLDDTSFEAEWDGEPQFATVEQNAGLEYALNTPDSVFRVGDTYYACEDSVWYESTSAFGPWWIATEVPDIIYDIPPSNPQHRVTYARIYDVTPDAVYVGYTPGYLNYYGYHGSVVFGSGWRYQPWYGSHYYSHHSSHYWGWGYQSYYQPWLAWAYVAPVYWPHHYTHNRHHYRNNRYYNQKGHHRRNSRHHGNYRNNGYRNSDYRNSDYRNDNGGRNENHKRDGSKSGRHRVDENRNDRQTAANNRNRNSPANASNRSNARDNTQDNTRNSNRDSTRTSARNNRARSDVTVAQHRARQVETTSNRAQRSRYQASNSTRAYASRSDRDRSERPRVASSARNRTTNNAAAANTYVSSGQHRARPSSPARGSDQSYRSTANPSRPAANQPVPTYSANDRSGHVASNSASNRSSNSVNSSARKPAADAKPPRQRSAQSSQRSDDQGRASRGDRSGARRHR